MADQVLRVRNLKVNFYTYDGVVKAIDGVDLDVGPHETLGLVGETGCGKSVTVNSLVKLIPTPPGRIESGRALLHWPVQCPKCGGKGCAACEGSGKLDKCEACSGRGRCAACRGHGRFRDGKSCEACAGVGTCHSCDGIGKRYVDLLALSPANLREVRGSAISMIFQESMSALNPVLRIGEQIGESLYYHQRDTLCQATITRLETEIKRLGGSVTGTLRLVPLRFFLVLYRWMLKRPESRSLQFLRKVPVVRRYHRWIEKEMDERSLEALRKVRIPAAEEVLRAYSYELSGGMTQRVVIAIALAGNPKVLVADEPTTALDVTIQSQILRLMQDLKAELGAAIIFITHDLAVIAQICDRVAVMYAGTIAESAPVRGIFNRPFHPYTRGLIGAIPRPHQDLERLSEIPGSVPNLVTPPTGCRFHPRCKFAKPEVCASEKPLLVEVETGHYAACHMYNHNRSHWTDEDRHPRVEVIAR
jgi:peptide/nickel transport system ATP-binding protein